MTIIVPIAECINERWYIRLEDYQELSRENMRTIQEIRSIQVECRNLMLRIDQLESIWKDQKDGRVCTDAKHVGTFDQDKDGNTTCLACGEYW